MLRMPNAALAAMLTTFLSGCAGTMASGDAGCLSYGEARRERPSDDAFRASDPEVVAWVGEVDARMTGACR